jgi:hypothetical protein
MQNLNMIKITPNIINLFKLLIRYILILIGLVMLLGYLWFRFVRERLPKDIPFTLTLMGFIILVYLCLIFAYIVYILLSKTYSPNPIISKIIKKLLDIIYKPLITLDETIKNNPLIHPYYKSFMDTFPVRFGYLFKEPYYFYYTFVILPRFILVTALCIDTFYYHQLYFIYKVLLIGIFLLFNRYVKYSMKYAKEQLILEWETLFKHIVIPYVPGVSAYEDPDDPNYGNPEYEDDVYETMYLSVRKYVNFQSYALVHYNYMKDPHVYGTEKYDEIFCKKYDISQKDLFSLHKPSPYYSIYTKEKEADLERIMQIPLLIEYYAKADNDTDIKRLKILIYTNYLLCWLYILIMSFNKLPTDTFDFIWKIIDIEEPFS